MRRRRGCRLGPQMRLEVAMWNFCALHPCDLQWPPMPATSGVNNSMFPWIFLWLMPAKSIERNSTVTTDKPPIRVGCWSIIAAQSRAVQRSYTVAPTSFSCPAVGSVGPRVSGCDCRDCPLGGPAHHLPLGGAYVPRRVAGSWNIWRPRHNKTDSLTCLYTRWTDRCRGPS